jgi:hypothetical protein
LFRVAASTTVKVVIVYFWAMRTCGIMNGYKSEVNIQHEASEIQTLQKMRLEHMWGAVYNFYLHVSLCKNPNFYM